MLRTMLIIFMLKIIVFIVCTTGIPLAYVIRSNVAPDYSIYHDTFNKQLIAQAPLQGRISLTIQVTYSSY